MDMLGFLFVILILTIAGSAYLMSDALNRLTASVAAISAGVARIGTEVSETAQAIRDHATGDGGISQATLLGLADQLDTAATQLTAAGDALDKLQHDDGGAGAGDQSGLGAGSDTSGLGDQSDTTGQNDGSDTSGVNQNGVGSGFETGGDGTDTGGTSDASAAAGASDASGSDDSGFGRSDV